ncbi:MAG: FecR domain-containing protein [Saprospiraceae bacterium]|nr:FecR domain-containing protein [Saprospiraceae bacterium]
MIDFYEIDELVAKILTDEATAAEQEMLRVQLAESSELQQYFEQMQRLWRASETATEQLDVNTDAAWVKVQTRIHAPQQTLKVSWFNTKNVFKMAAAIALLTAASFFIFQKKPPLSMSKPEIIVATQDAVLEKTLADSSMITLNKKSSLTTAFTEKERRVKLVGEAFFEVAHDTVKPFFIDVQNLEIRVVGTAFNVDERSEQGKITVSVTEGRVLLRGTKRSILLSKGEETKYIVATGEFETTANRSLNFMAYKTKELVYEGQPLSKVARDINEYYGVSVEIISEYIKNCPISGRFNFGEQKLDLILEQFISNQITDLKIDRKDNDRILLKGTKCSE